MEFLAGFCVLCLMQELLLLLIRDGGLASALGTGFHVMKLLMLFRAVHSWVVNMAGG